MRVRTLIENKGIPAGTVLEVIKCYRARKGGWYLCHGLATDEGGRVRDVVRSYAGGEAVPVEMESGQLSMVEEV